jgi:glycosyltransferase involved in cell wall biosynthesis
MDNLDALLADARRRGVEDVLLVTGFRRDIPHVVGAADVVAFPSLLPEGFGRPIIEGMALGLPVIATDVGPSRDLLGEEAGLLVQPTASSLSQALAALLADPSLRARQGAAGRKRVEERFALPAQVSAMSRIYREAARG